LLAHPIGSLLWHTPEALRLRADDRVHEFVVDFFAFNVPWRKRTRFLAGNCDAADIESIRGQYMCSGKRVCCFTGKTHFKNVGEHYTGIPKSLLAQQFPQRLCMVLAGLLTSKQLDRRFAYPAIDDSILCW